MPRQDPPARARARFDLLVRLTRLVQGTGEAWRMQPIRAASARPAHSEAAAALLPTTRALLMPGPLCA
jgi:hypothetical protein